jgi:hypothetical protein
MGSKLGGIHCSGCGAGIALPDTPLDPDSSSWTCDQCGAKLPGQDCVQKVKFLNKNIQTAIADSKGSIQVFEFVSLQPNPLSWCNIPKTGENFLDDHIIYQKAIKLAQIPTSSSVSPS